MPPFRFETVKAPIHRGSHNPRKFSLQIFTEHTLAGKNWRPRITGPKNRQSKSQDVNRGLSAERSSMRSGQTPRRNSFIPQGKCPGLNRATDFTRDPSKKYPRCWPRLQICRPSLMRHSFREGEREIRECDGRLSDLCAALATLRVIDRQRFQLDPEYSLRAGTTAWLVIGGGNLSLVPP